MRFSTQQHQLYCGIDLHARTMYRKIGRRAEARAALTTAIEMFRAMEIPFWLPQAEAELAQVERGTTLSALRP